MTRSKIDIPTDVPTPIATALQESSDRQLRAAIHYAHQLLWEQPPLTDALEAREGEEIVRIDDHGAYASVVVEPTGGADSDGGRYVYRVQWEPRVDGDGGQYRWHYLGRVEGGGE